MAKKKPSPKKGKRQPRYDWKKIRVAREVGGKSFRDLQREFGPTNETIRQRSKREKWRDPVEVAAESSRKAANSKLAGLVSQEAEAVFKNRCEHAQISADLLEWVKKRVGILTSPNASPLLDVDLIARRLSLTLKTLGLVDADVAGLAKAGDDFRSVAGGGAGDSGAFGTEVRAALDRLGGSKRARS